MNVSKSLKALPPASNNNALRSSSSKGGRDKSTFQFPQTDAIPFERLAILDSKSMEFNVGNYKNNMKLQKIIAHSQRNKGSSIDLRARTLRRIAKLEDLLAKKIGEYLENRLMNSGLSKQNRFVRLGDEFRLRQIVTYDKIDVNARDPHSGRTLICEAAATGQLAIARYLCDELRVNLSKPTMLGGVTALHLAVENGYRQIASTLITYGANMSAQDIYGNTPLHYVKKKSLLRLMMKNGVDPLIRNKKGDLPIEHYLRTTGYRVVGGGLSNGQKEKKENNTDECSLASNGSMSTKSVSVSVSKKKKEEPKEEENLDLVLRDPEIVRDLERYTENAEKDRIREELRLEKEHQERILEAQRLQIQQEELDKKAKFLKSLK